VWRLSLTIYRNTIALIPDEQPLLELELEFFLRPTVSRPVRLGIGPPFGILDQILACSSSFVWQLRRFAINASQPLFGLRIPVIGSGPAHRKPLWLLHSCVIRSIATNYCVWTDQLKTLLVKRYSIVALVRYQGHGINKPFPGYGHLSIVACGRFPHHSPPTVELVA
jgi:hypothetical protein